MALIGKIRNNSWILIVMIAVGMGGFILQDVMTNQGQRQAANFELANINGKSIDYREFQETESILYAGSANADPYAQKSSLWRYYTEKAIVESEAEELGIGVSTDELMDLQFGEKLSPIITARFKAQNGQVDRERLNSFRDAIEANELDARFKQYWAVQEKEIIKERQQTKLQNLFAKAVFTPNWLAEEISKEANSKADFAVFKIRFDQISDEGIEVTDAQIEEYLKENKASYTNEEESRILKYVEFPVLPTSSDSLVNKEELSTIGKEFKEAANDSLFLVNNSGNYTNIYYLPEDLPQQIKEVVTTMEAGEVYGPYLDMGKFTIAKLLDKKMVADSVKARHILRSIDPQNPTSYVDAQKMIDSLKTVLENGTDSFDSLAIKYSQDPGSSFNGGDLGYFTQGTMVVPFNDACFHGDPDEYQVVISQFGIHLIDIQDRKFLDNNPKYNVGYISNAIVPSQETQDSVFDKATELVTMSTTLEELEERVNQDSSLSIKLSTPLRKNDYSFMNFGSESASREIIRWAYEPGMERGDISPVVYTYTDKVNYYNSTYVVAALQDIYPKGLRSVNEVRNSVELLVANKLKSAKLIKELAGKDLNEVASEYEITPDTVVSLAFNATNDPILRNEPKVMNLVFNSPINETAGPVVGNAGVFMVKPIFISIADEPAANFLQQKNTTESTFRNQISFKFIEALKKIADIEDNRYTYY
jgi:peptidyl-prolyl cis-trans isomerase D